MMENPWISERETGRWFMWYTEPDGSSVRRYSDEIDLANDYQSQSAYQPEPRSYREVYEYETGLSNDNDQEASSYPRSSRPEATTSYENKAVASSRRREQRYNNPGGYSGQASSATYQNIVQASSNRDIGYEALRDTARLNENGSWSGSNYGLSIAPPQLQYKAAPQGRSQGQYQSKGKEPASEAPSQPRYIKATAGKAEKLDSIYQVRTTDWKEFFKRGRVFKTLCIDSPGLQIQGESSQSMRSATDARYKIANGEYAYSKIRPFIVVSRHNNSCQCLPVTTYDGKGYKKTNIILEEHGLIYTDEKPNPVPGINRDPLKIRDARETIDISYINYGRPYCVHTNVKVKEVGMLDGRSRRLLRKYYQAIHSINDNEHSDDLLPVSQEAALFGTGSGVQIIGENIQPSKNDNNDSRPGARQTSPQSSESRPNESQSEVPRESLLSSLMSDQHNDCKVHDVNSPELIDEQTLKDSSKTVGLILRRSDSTSSLSSLASLGIFSSTSSVSSASSAHTEPRYQQRLENLLLTDPKLHVLLEEAASRISFSKLEDNFRRCLQVFSEHLRIEAPPSLPKSTSKAIRKFSRNVAHTVRRNFEGEAGTSGLVTCRPEYFEDEGEEDVEYEDEDDDASEDIDDHCLPLESTIRATQSFSMLYENFRIFLLSDQVLRAVFECWPVTLLWSTSVAIEYSGIANVVQYLESRPLGQRQLASILAFIGTDDTVEAISCEEYLVRQWPRIGQCLVDFLNQFHVTDNPSMLPCVLHALILTFILTGELEKRIPTIDVSMSFGSEDRRSGPYVTVAAPYQWHGQIATAVSWLCAVLRNSPHEEICRSSVSVKAIKKLGPAARHLTAMNDSIHFEVNNLEVIKNPLTCWHSLFPHNVIAQGHPIRPRSKGKGLEISFVNLAFASRCLSFVEYDNGFIAHGLKSVLVPVAELEEDNAIQWHYESKAPKASGKLLSIRAMIQDRIGPWYKESDPERLISRRCFLGWVEEANVVMGTSAYSLHLQSSGAPICPPVAKLRRFEFTGGVSAMSWVTLQGTFVQQPVSISNSVATQQGDLLDVLNLATADYGVVFEHQNKTGWCIPRASLVLQIVHSIISSCQYELFDGDKCLTKDDRRPYAEIAADGGSKALEAVKRSLSLMIEKPRGETGQHEQEIFSDMVSRIWHMLEDVTIRLQHTANELQMVGRSTTKHLLGVDLSDVIINKRPMMIRRIEVNQPWLCLMVEQPLVLTCSSLSAPIVPASSICESHSTVPKKQNLLVATATTVQALLDSQDHGLAHGLDWCVGSKLIDVHEVAENRPIQHVQKLRLKKTPPCNTKIRTTLQACLRGAFIFGDGTEKKCMARNVSAQQDQREILSSPLHISVSSVPSSASATSADVDNDTGSRSSSSLSQHESVSDQPTVAISSPKTNTQDLQRARSLNQLGSSTDRLWETSNTQRALNSKPVLGSNRYNPLSSSISGSVEQQSILSSTVVKTRGSEKGMEPVRKTLRRIQDSRCNDPVAISRPSSDSTQTHHQDSEYHEATAVGSIDDALCFSPPSSYSHAAPESYGIRPQIDLERYFSERRAQSENAYGRTTGSSRWRLR